MNARRFASYCLAVGSLHCAFLRFLRRLQIVASPRACSKVTSGVTPAAWRRAEVVGDAVDLVVARRVATFQETTRRACFAFSWVNSGSANSCGLFSAMPTVSLACAAAGTREQREDGDQEQGGGSA